MKIMSNPFRYGRAVFGDQYYDRAAVGESLYRTIAGGLSATQRSVLSALAASPTNRFDAEYRRRYGIGPSSTVHGALEKLVDKGHVEKTAQGYFVGDPFFARYLTAMPYEVMESR